MFTRLDNLCGKDFTILNTIRGGCTEVLNAHHTCNFSLENFFHETDEWPDFV